MMIQQNEQDIIGKVYVQNCTNGKTYYMLEAGNYGKWFESMPMLRRYARYYGIKLDSNVTYM